MGRRRSEGAKWAKRTRQNWKKRFKLDDVEEVSRRLEAKMALDVPAGSRATIQCVQSETMPMLTTTTTTTGGEALSARDLLSYFAALLALTVHGTLGAPARDDEANDRRII